MERVPFTTEEAYFARIHSLDGKVETVTQMTIPKKKKKPEAIAIYYVMHVLAGTRPAVSVKTISRRKRISTFVGSERDVQAVLEYIGRKKWAIESNGKWSITVAGLTKRAERKPYHLMY